MDVFELAVPPRLLRGVGLYHLVPVSFGLDTHLTTQYAAHGDQAGRDTLLRDPSLIDNCLADRCPSACLAFLPYTSDPNVPVLVTLQTLLHWVLEIEIEWIN